MPSGLRLKEFKIGAKFLLSLEMAMQVITSKANKKAPCSTIALPKPLSRSGRSIVFFCPLYQISSTEHIPYI